jgi:hypothetical protein
MRSRVVVSAITFLDHWQVVLIDLRLCQRETFPTQRASFLFKNTSGLHFDLTTCQIEIPEIEAPAGGRLEPDGGLSGSGETDISFDGLPGDAHRSYQESHLSNRISYFRKRNTVLKVSPRQAVSGILYFCKISGGKSRVASKLRSKFKILPRELSISSRPNRRT